MKKPKLVPLLMMRLRGLCGPMPQKTKNGKLAKSTGNAYSAGVK